MCGEREKRCWRVGKEVVKGEEEGKGKGCIVCMYACVCTGRWMDALGVEVV